MFYYILQLLALRTQNSLFNDNKVLECYLKSLLTLDLLGICDYFDSFVKQMINGKEETIKNIETFEEVWLKNSLTQELIVYIKGLSEKEYKQFEEFAAQEYLLCKIKGISLRNLRVI